MPGQLEETDRCLPFFHTCGLVGFSLSKKEHRRKREVLLDVPRAAASCVVGHELTPGRQWMYPVLPVLLRTTSVPSSHTGCQGGKRRRLHVDLPLPDTPPNTTPVPLHMANAECSGNPPDSMTERNTGYSARYIAAAPRLRLGPDGGDMHQLRTPGSLRRHYARASTPRRRSNNHYSR